MGEHLDVTYLVTFTQSGDTARRLSRLRSPLPLLAFTPLHETRNQLAVSWGVQSYEVPEVQHTDEMVAQVDEILQDKHLAQPGGHRRHRGRYASGNSWLYQLDPCPHRR